MNDLYFSELKNSLEFAKEILRRYGITQPMFYRNEHGKPFLAGDALFFSLSHSKDTIAIAVSNSPVGLDLESLSATREYHAVLSRFSPAERSEITDYPSFLRNWTAKESYVKLLGVSLGQMLSALEFRNAALYRNGEKLDVCLQSGITRGSVFTVCTREPLPVKIHRL